MDPIPNIGVPITPSIQIYNSRGIPEIPYWQITQPYVPNFYPVTNHMGFPIVDIPGCVMMHQDDKYHKRGLSVDKSLVTNDSDQVMTLCPDGSYPSYDAMNYEPEQLLMTYEQKAPPIAPPPDAPDTPEAPTDAIPEEKDPDCPGPNQPRIGDVAQNQKEKVSGYELQKDPVNPGKKICVILYEDITVAEQYLPSAQVASTTAVIATVATGSALLAKPLADLLLRVFRPAIKQAIGRVQKLLGKSPDPDRRSVRDRMIEQRDRTKAIRALKGMKPR